MGHYFYFTKSSFSSYWNELRREQPLRDGGRIISTVIYINRPKKQKQNTFDNTHTKG
jgi:hypothetical protein